jgi:hypothetical protein
VILIPVIIWFRPGLKARPHKAQGFNPVLRFKTPRPEGPPAITASPSSQIITGVRIRKQMTNFFTTEMVTRRLGLKNSLRATSYV